MKKLRNCYILAPAARSALILADDHDTRELKFPGMSCQIILTLAALMMAVRWRGGNEFAQRA